MPEHSQVRAKEHSPSWPRACARTGATPMQRRHRVTKRDSGRPKLSKRHGLGHAKYPCRTPSLVRCAPKPLPPIVATRRVRILFLPLRESQGGARTAPQPAPTEHTNTRSGHEFATLGDEPFRVQSRSYICIRSPPAIQREEGTNVKRLLVIGPEAWQPGSLAEDATGNLPGPPPGRIRSSPPSPRPRGLAAATRKYPTACGVYDQVQG